MSEMEQQPICKIALGIEYDGSKYYGWQRQNEVRSVQEKLEKALSQVANEPITVFCAGRTDAGVHGTGQVVHFETRAQRKDAAWTLGVNANLPGDIAVRWVKHVPADFHARFSATARRYRYVIYNHRLRPAVLSQGVTHFHQPLDAERMQRAAQCLLGENDFTSFRAVQCQSRTPWRNVMHINVTRYGAYVVVDIKANAFVHHMVRNIVGSLMEVGAGNQPESWMAELLAAKDRTLAAATAKAEGLYLVSVDYPAHYDLPVLQWAAVSGGLIGSLRVKTNMDLIHFLIDFILHIDVHLAELVAQYGVWIYAILFLILFCETGLVVTPFLPGDSLLFVAGALSALPTNDLNVHLMVLLMVIAAIVGDAVNYTIGRLFGEKLFSNPNSKIFRRSYLDKTHSFYERHGGKTIILARFVPIVRTFAPFVAGMGHMSYRHFAAYNVVGALLWVLLFTYAGYLFGDLPVVQENLKLLIVAIIVLSVLPGVIEIIRHKRAAAKQAK